MKAICIYCGSSPGHDPIYVETATAMGTAIAKRGMTLVYGGGRVGLMGTVADAALAAGGDVIGIIPQSLVDKEIQHRGVTKLHVVDSMHTRKAMLIELSDAMIALPGGFGTYDELAEAFTWAQLGFHQKPIGLLNVKGFYDPLVAQLDMAIREGFIREGHRDIMLVDTEIERLLDRVIVHEVPQLIKWTDANNDGKAD
jgi:uncharacterized protein (TIGR00730 family)